jgi:PAS domain S-box-containing protein
MHNVFGRYGLRVLVIMLLLLSGFAMLVTWGVGEKLGSELEHQIRKNVESELGLLGEGFYDLATVEHYATAVRRLQVFCDSNTEVRMLRVTTPMGSTLFQFQRQTTGRAESFTKVLKLGPDEQVRFEMETDLSAVDALTATTRLHVMLALLSVIVPVGIGLWLVIRKLALQPMEHSLQEKEAGFFVTLKSIGDAVLSTDIGGRIVFINPVAETFTGWSIDEARQCPVSEVFKIIDFVTREPAPISIEKVLATRAVVDLADHATLIAKDGTERQIALSGAPIRYADGKVTGVVLVCRDLSEAYAKNQQLRESEERYRAIAEDTPVLICRFLPSREIVYVNEAYCSYFEKTPEELVGSSLLFQIPEDDREIVMANITALTIDSPTQSYEHKVFSPGGEIRWQRWTNRALFGSEGQLVAYQAIGEDITQRKQAEQALQESQSRFALFMDYLPAAIFIKNAQSQILYVNQYLKTHFGAKESQGRNICEHSPEVTEQLVRNDRKALAEGRLELVETLKDRAGRARTFQTHKFVIPQPEGKPVLLGGIAWDITDSLAASEALRRSERRYREMFEVAQEGIWLIDAEARTVEVNERMARMLGYTIDEMRGRHLFEFMDEEARTEADVFLDRRRKGIAEKYDFRYRTKTGADLWTMVSTAPMHDAQGAYAGALRMVTDITERKRSEDALRSNEQRLRLILASTGEGIFGLDMNGCCTFANRACIELLGFTEEEDLLGKRMHELIHHTHHDGTNYPEEECPTYRSCTLRHVTFADDELLWRADGSAFHAQYQSFPMMRDEAVLGAVVTFADITERKLAEAAIKHERDFAERLIETAPVIVLVLDPKGNIIRFNSFMQKLSGYSLAEVKGKNWFDTFFAKHDVPRVSEIFTRAKSGIPTSGNVNAILTRDGKERLIAWYDTTLRDAGGELSAVLAIGHDVTEQKAKEMQLLQAQKMEMVGQLTGGIAHDFNNLLTVILGNMQLLTKTMDLDDGDPAVFELLDDALSAARDAAELTKRLLAVSRKEPLQRQGIDLSSFLRDLQRFLRRTLGPDITVQVDVEANLNQLFCDRPQLESALLNLALNARDAMPKGGQLTLQAEVKEEAELDLTLEPGTCVELSVVDTGEGMTTEQLSHAIEPLYTTKRSTMGTGLGLSMVYGFCEQAGGRFRLESKPGAGTRATIILPLNGESDQEAEQTLEIKPRTVTQTGTVLVVEDEARVRKLAGRYLKDFGYKVLFAENGESAIETLQSESAVELVFSDIVMPGKVNGNDLYLWVKAHRPKMKVLLTTGLRSKEVAESAKEVGPAVPIVLPKPYSKERLAAAIRDLF